jgi:hypothetical protein
LRNWPPDRSVHHEYSYFAQKVFRIGRERLERNHRNRAAVLKSLRTGAGPPVPASVVSGGAGLGRICHMPTW